MHRARVDRLLDIVKRRVGSPKVRDMILRGDGAYGNASTVDRIIEWGYTPSLQGNAHLVGQSVRGQESSASSTKIRSSDRRQVALWVSSTPRHYPRVSLYHVGRADDCHFELLDDVYVTCIDLASVYTGKHEWPPGVALVRN